MARELRLAMAMGGGVSLGTFSGGALTQTIKLLFVNNLINKLEGEAYYDKIVIDAFSGASAGALALTVMLKAFTAPDETVFDENSQLHKQLWNSLYTEFGANLGKLLDKANQREKMQLLLIQYAQHLQEQAWVKTVNLERLLRRDKLPSDIVRMEHDPSILYLKTYEDIAALFLSPGEEGYTGTLNPSGVLAESVTFACSLSRLNPVVADGRKQYQLRLEDKASIALNDALRSFIHRDMRVFDIHFNALKEDQLQRLPKRWYRLHTGDADTQSESHILENISHKSSWQIISATAIACGCFPVAFRPVLLERHRCEFGENLWPEQIDSLPENINKVGCYTKDRYPFTYIDGGVFNNEPLREAFRLAYYQDMRKTHVVYDRRVLFVDPIVSDDVIPLGLSMYSRFGSNRNQNAFRKKGSVLGLKDTALAIGLAIKNQARLNEADKVFAKWDEFKLRKAYRDDFVKMPLGNVADKSVLRVLAKECSKQLEKKRLSDKLASVQTNLEYEIKRIIFETKPKFDELVNQTDQFLRWLGDDESEWPYADNDEIAAKWYKLLMLSRLDIMMDMEGVDNRAKLISISPHKVELSNSESRYTIEPLNLKGSPLFAFAGFISEDARNADFASGKWASFHFLSFDEHFNNSHSVFEGQKELPVREVDFTQGIQRSARQLSLRLDEMVRQGSKDLRFWSGNKGIRLFSRFIPWLITRFLNEQKLADTLKENINPSKQFDVSLLITGNSSSFSIIAANNRWNQYLPKFGLDTELSSDIQKRLSAGRRRISIVSEKHWPFNENKEADQRHCITLDVKAVLNNSDALVWESRYVSHGYILLRQHNERLFLIKLPEASILQKGSTIYGNVLTLDLGTIESTGLYSLIGDSSWSPDRHLYPTDDKRAFDF